MPGRNSRKSTKLNPRRKVSRRAIDKEARLDKQTAHLLANPIVNTAPGRSKHFYAFFVDSVLKLDDRERRTDAAAVDRGRCEIHCQTACRVSC